MNKDIGTRHREVRENHLKLSVERYAAAVGVKEVTIYSWESGRTAVPQRILAWLAKEHNVSSHYMLTGQGASQAAPDSSLTGNAILSSVHAEIEKLQRTVQALRASGPQVVSHAATKLRKVMSIPLLSLGVSAGSPVEADDAIERHIDLAEMLLEHPDSTYIMRVVGDSMQDAGISDGDMLIVDCAIQAKSGQVVIAKIYGELTVKRYILNRGVPMLKAENILHKDIHITLDMDFSIVGVVRSCIKQL